jgi:hypothetical protein
MGCARCRHWASRKTLRVSMKLQECSVVRSEVTQTVPLFLIALYFWFRHVDLPRISCEHSAKFAFIGFILYGIMFCDV